MNNFATNRPYLFSFAIFAIESIAAVPFVVAFNLLDLDLEPLRLIIPIAQTFLVIWILYALGWIKAAGFGGKIKNIHVLWFPLILAFVPVLLFGTIEIAPNAVMFYAFALAFTGISEEGFARGILLKALLVKGPWVALMFTSILFSVGHLSNLLFEDFSAFEMMERLLTTFSFAILYGSVFLRTQNIWPLIVLHAVHDFSFLTSGTAGPYLVEPLPSEVNLVLALISILYAVIIMRKVAIVSN